MKMVILLASLLTSQLALAKSNAAKDISYDCVSTVSAERTLMISVGADIQVLHWNDRELISSLVLDIGIQNLTTPWRVANSEWNCANNYCPSFSFAPQKKILKVNLYENDEMGSYYTQTYSCR